MIRRPPRSTLSSSSAASDVYKRQIFILNEMTKYRGGTQVKKTKKFLGLLLIGFVIFTLTACSTQPSTTKQAQPDGSENSKVKIGLLTGVGGLGDKSFNDLADIGAKKAESDLGVQLKVVEPPD